MEVLRKITKREMINPSYHKTSLNHPPLLQSNPHHSPIHYDMNFFLCDLSPALAASTAAEPYSAVPANCLGVAAVAVFTLVWQPLPPGWYRRHRRHWRRRRRPVIIIR
jgi:hypothetical protein